MFTKDRFYLDAFPDLEFEGYHEGRDWNGWAVPYFEYSEAERVMKASESNGYSWKYDDEVDAFSVGDELGAVAYDAKLIWCDGTQLKVYGIGAAEWIWSIVE